VWNICRRLGLEDLFSTNDNIDCLELIHSKEFVNICRVFKPCRDNSRTNAAKNDDTFLNHCLGVEFLDDIIDEDDLLFILLASPLMLRNILDYGKIVFGDASHGVTTIVGLKLLNLMVVDHNGNGRPIGNSLHNGNGRPIGNSLPLINLASVLGSFPL